MSLLLLSNFSLSVGSTQLLEGVNGQVVGGQRIALVGCNGSGKSTLLRAIANPHGRNYFVVGSGTVQGSVYSSDSILLVEQDDLQWSRLMGGEEAEVREMTIAEALENAVMENERAIDDDEAWRKLSVAAHDALKWHTAKYADTPLGQLSPGCAVRAYLAVALHRYGTEVLLLDEPTNHLDLPSILWLQYALLHCKKTVIIVSHDAKFLDAVCNHVWAIDKYSKTLTISGASYSDLRRAEEIAQIQQEAAYEQQQKRNKRLRAMADKLRSASTQGQFMIAKDKDKLQRDFKRDRAGRSGRKAKSLETYRDSQPVVECVAKHRPLHIEIDALSAATHGSIILSSVVLGYGPSQPLPLPSISLRVDFGERIGIVGFNGVGKSTLLRTIAGLEKPVSGEVCMGGELRLGNLMQEHETLPRDQTPRSFFSKETGVSMFNTASRLIRYGLTRQQVDCPIGELNPGARARALLAGFSMLSVNTLILDEPTNHLDEEAVKEVVACLESYSGTVIVVSHNRSFLESLELTHLLCLSSEGLLPIDSVDSFVGSIEERVEETMIRCYRR